MVMGYGGSSDAKWEPSVKYLLGLLLAEIFVVGIMRGLTHHGG
jgi:hypothetical protein